MGLVVVRARVGWQKACVAMANKNARILWAVMTRGEGFDAKHVSVKPPCKCAKPGAQPHAQPEDKGRGPEAAVVLKPESPKNRVTEKAKQPASL